MILNVCCGSSKIPGCINIDVEPSCKPDVLADVTKGLPWGSEQVDKIYFFHAIEHIPEKQHQQVLGEFYRVLKPEGRLVISYPEFSVCALNWANNYKGMRDFWKATLYGRQLYPSDFHVALMHTPDFKIILRSVGFINITEMPEGDEPYNTVIKCVKGQPMMTYEDVLRNELFGN